MKPDPGSVPRQTRQRRRHVLTLVFALFLLQGLPAICLPCLYAEPQEAAEPANQSQAELARRLEAARDARDSHDEAAVARANERLIGLVFRELAHLHLVESDYSQAISLYNDSLNYDNISETRIDLAIAELEGSH